MSMTYVPTWERKYDPWDLEPDENMIFEEEEIEEEEIEIEEIELGEDFDA